MNDIYIEKEDKEMTILEYCKKREAEGHPVTVNELKRKFGIYLPKEKRRKNK